MLDYRLIMSVRFIERCEENGKGRETQAGYSVKKKKEKKRKKKTRFSLCVRRTFYGASYSTCSTLTRFVNKICEKSREKIRVDPKRYYKLRDDTTRLSA